MVIKICQFFTGMITKIITVIALMVLYYHHKFESAAIHRSQDMRVFNFN